MLIQNRKKYINFLLMAIIFNLPFVTNVLPRCLMSKIYNKENNTANKIIHLSVQLQCNIHKAFEMFTVNEQIESWLTAVAEVEPYIGGMYELFWEPDDRENNSTIGCKVTAMENDKFISFEWRSPKQFKHFANNADPLTHVVVFFIPHGEETEVHMIHSGWRSSSEWEEARQWQEKAWKLSLGRLVKIVNQG